ncbi:hypothetical protein LJC02_02980 [Breznakia sp. OttesenSCG-928-G09]|nr:hypothetical protein [Breznakia sp. OttesenSCG-928-G09]
MEEKEYYRTTSLEVIEDLKTNEERGLTKEQVLERQEQYGKNILETGEKVSVWEILFEKVNNIIVYLLLAAAIVSFFDE